MEELVLVRAGMLQSHCWNKKHFWFGKCGLIAFRFWTVGVQNVQREEVQRFIGAVNF